MNFYYLLVKKTKNIYILQSIIKNYFFLGGWGMGDGGWVLGIGAQPPIPNPQSPIPNPQYKTNHE